MGKEAKAQCIVGEDRIWVRAHLDAQTLKLSGEKKIQLSLDRIKKVVVRGEHLCIKSGVENFELVLGAKEATAWAKKILNPPSLATKLGLREGLTVTLVGALPQEIFNVAPSAKRQTRLPANLSTDISIIALAPPHEASMIAATAKRLQANGVAWFVYKKGQPFNGDHVIERARKSGLKDTKVARVSETHTGLRFMRADRNK